ncbi:hypothetical protein [Bradyrhizobium australafricanum]|uniref:hypothetical protein n=1 Tax=Bradyrhizobium australafricanum TaxID=2821406 RepID=UPI001CE2EF61|nr:hypothetical protein [Bradyrhizobium australafricanum]MCA6098892.1 hypothetical protein [Bradyrhizobium australafricanum]
MNDDYRVERAARAICKADGNDPDRQVPTGRMETVREDHALVCREATESAWRKYEKEAQRFIAALDAMSDD